jgi:hypothetical protein
MGRRAWVASFGMAVLLGAAGCSSVEGESTGPDVKLLPGDGIPSGNEPPTEVGPPPGEELPPAEQPPPVEPPPPAEEPPPVVEDAACPKPDLGRMPSEEIFEPWHRPSRAACEVSPDGCDALRPKHARRNVPRPCAVRNTAYPDEVVNNLKHDTAGRLTSFGVASGRHGRYDSYDYDACHRTTRRAWGFYEQSGYGFQTWKRDTEGRLLERHFETNYFNSSLTPERDATGLLTGMKLQPRHGTEDLTLFRHQYSLDAEGRVLGGTGASVDVDGYWSGLSEWVESRRYSAAGELLEVSRTDAADGHLLWLKELYQGRLVRYLSNEGRFEQHWRYGASEEVVSYEETFDARGSREYLVADYRYGDDGRLLRVDTTTRTWREAEAEWSDALRITTYAYADDGRLLFRKDVVGTGPEAQTTTYQYDYVCEQP